MSVTLAPGGARATVARDTGQKLLELRGLGEGEASRRDFMRWVAFETRVMAINGVSIATVGQGPEQESGGKHALTPGWGMNGGRVSGIAERNGGREVAAFLWGGDCPADISV